MRLIPCKLICLLSFALIHSAAAAEKNTPLDIWANDIDSAYKGARQFAWCAAYYDGAAALVQSDAPAVSQEYADTSRGAVVAGGFLLYMQQIGNELQRMEAAKANGSETASAKELKGLPYFSDLVEIWRDSFYQSIEAKLEAASLEDVSGQESAETSGFLAEYTAELGRCLELSNPYQATVVEALRQFSVEQSL